MKMEKVRERGPPKIVHAHCTPYNYVCLHVPPGQQLRSQCKPLAQQQGWFDPFEHCFAVHMAESSQDGVSASVDDSHALLGDSALLLR
jgi:hypothetical protein